MFPLITVSDRMRQRQIARQGIDEHHRGRPRWAGDLGRSGRTSWSATAGIPARLTCRAITIMESAAERPIRPADRGGMDRQREARRAEPACPSPAPPRPSARSASGGAGSTPGAPTITRSQSWSPSPPRSPGVRTRSSPPCSPASPTPALKNAPRRQTGGRCISMAVGIHISNGHGDRGRPSDPEPSPQGSDRLATGALGRHQSCRGNCHHALVAVQVTCLADHGLGLLMGALPKPVHRGLLRSRRRCHCRTGWRPRFPCHPPDQWRPTLSGGSDTTPRPAATVKGVGGRAGALP
ncbi:Uncharacterised protein [Mycobacterium tuberculosis]|nr:Uncharacterised protein [Mycobacterium tuberculosis]